MRDEIIEQPFDWNDNMSEIAQEDFAEIRKSLSYGVALSIGMALAKLELLERQGCKVEPQENCDTCKHKDDGWDSEHCDWCCGNHSGFEPQESEEISREEIAALLARGSEEMTREEAKVKTFDILRFIADNAGLSMFEAIEKAYYMGVSEQEPKTGHWIVLSPTDMCCSECNEIEHLDTSRRFCAYCGTRMSKNPTDSESEEQA